MPGPRPKTDKIGTPRHGSLSNDRRAWKSSTVVSILLHLLVAFLVNRAIYAKYANREQSSKAVSETEELVVKLEELESPPDLAEKDTQLADNQKVFLKTDQNQQQKEAPKDVKFRAEHNTKASSELDADSNGREAMPSQKGEKPLSKDDVGIVQQDWYRGKLDGLDSIQQEAKVASVSLGSNVSDIIEKEKDPDKMSPEEKKAEMLNLLQSINEERLKGKIGDTSEQEKQAEMSRLVQNINADRLSGKIDTSTPLDFSEADSSPNPQEVSQNPQALGTVPASQVSNSEQFRTTQEATQNQGQSRTQGVQSSTVGLSGNFSSQNQLAGFGQIMPGIGNAQGMASGANQQAVPEKNPYFQGFQRKTEIKGTAKNEGTSSVSAQANTPSSIYYAALDKVIDKHWGEESTKHREFNLPGTIVFSFVIDNQGIPSQIRCLKTEGASDLQKGYTFKILKSIAFPPLSEELLKEQKGKPLEVKYSFIFLNSQAVKAARIQRGP